MKKIQWQKIQTIANNNKFPPQLITEMKAQMQQNTLTITTKEENRNCATFTYHSSQIRKITNLFKHTDIKIAFRSTNTVQQLTKPKKQKSNKEHNKCGVPSQRCLGRAVAGGDVILVVV
jgi:DNA mismatch repair ATPase MutS